MIHSLLQNVCVLGTTHGLYSIGVHRAEACAVRQLVGRTQKRIVRVFVFLASFIGNRTGGEVRMEVRSPGGPPFYTDTEAVARAKTSLRCPAVM